MSTIIKVCDLVKKYRLYAKPVDRLKETIHPLRKKYHKEFYALKGISFEIQKGDSVGIIGKNGAGKSTLLKILTRVLTPTSGDIQINGRVASLLELGAGFNPEMTGVENIYLYGTLLGFSQEQIDARAEDIIAFADIGDFINQKVKMYSSGMLARLAFASAVHVEPDILIVDEALSVGDIFFQQKCIMHMKKMMNDGVTLLFVSHSLAAVKSLCNKAVYLKKGEIVDYGDAETVCTIYQNEDGVSDKDSKNEAIARAQLSLLERENVTFLSNYDTKINKYYREDATLSQRISERGGSGELVITAFDIYDENNNMISMCETFDKICIRVSFKACEDIPEGACLGVLCRDLRGIDVFSCNMNYYGCFLPKLKMGDQGVIEIWLCLPLLNGTYFFSAGFKPEPCYNYFYDRPFNVACLEVKSLAKIAQEWHGGLIYIEPFNIACGTSTSTNQ